VSAPLRARLARLSCCGERPPGFVPVYCFAHHLSSPNPCSAFLKPYPSPSASPYAEPSASFETAFFFTSIVLCGAFLFAVWWLRRDGSAVRSQQPSVFATVRAVLARRRKENEAEHERQRLSAASAGGDAARAQPALPDSGGFT